MGKAKKGKKGSKDEEVESDSDSKPQDVAKDAAAKAKLKPKGKPDAGTVISDDEPVSKKPGKNKKGSGADVSEMSKNMKNLKIVNTKKIKADSDDPDSDTEKEIKPPKSKSQPAKVGFALLMDNSEESEESDHASEKEEVESDEEEKKPISKTSKKGEQSKDQGGKKNKKSRRKRDDSDEDIDKVLAELEMEYSGVKVEPAVEEKPAQEKTEGEPSKSAKKKGKKDERKTSVSEVQEGEDEDVDEDSSTVKTAAQKKKEKKDREKQKKLAAKKQGPAEEKEVEPKVEEAVGAESAPVNEPSEQPSQESKKKKKGEKAEKADEKEKKKGPSNKTIAAMQDALKKLKEDEERLQREEEERIRLEDEREVQRLEAIRLEQEKKDKKKKKEKERKERLKAEGKLLTAKQKADKARAQAMLESLKAQGVDVSADRKPRLGTRIKPNKLKQQLSQEQPQEIEPADTKVEVEIVDKKEEELTPELKEEETVKDSWDADSSSDEEPQVKEKPVANQKESVAETKSEERSESSEEGEETEDDDDDSDDSESSDDSEDQMTDAERNRQKALQRIAKRQEENEKNKTSKVLRAAVVCVLGHVDTGKTKILDKLRRTNVQDGEAGGITQQIGATNVPIENIKEQTRHVKAVNEIDFKVPGLLIIDTPGHESFSNLRNRGSSLCDLAILVVDIMHGLEPQTIESINLLKSRKTPFIVALNKIDRLYDWQSAQRKDIRDILKSQGSNTQAEFDRRLKDAILQFAEQGLNAALFSENPDPRTYVSLVPTSAVTGEGMGNLLALIVQVCEGPLHKRLIFSQTLQATVLEVKAISGLGTTIDAILINGTLREGDTVVLAGTDGPIVTQIRSLLMPQPMKELRVKNAYIEYKEIVAAQGVKIAGKDLEKAIAGLNLLVAHKPDEVDILREEVAKELKSALSGIRLSERGVYVQASTLGSLEALLEFLRTSKIPYSAIRIGPVVKRDVMKASAMLEHDSQFATILAFDVKIERDAQEMADNLGVKIFQADIIYHLFDKFTSYRDELKQKKRDEFKSIAVFPCKLKVMAQFVFNSRDPIVCGVMIEAGIVKEGTPICVPSREFVDIGIVTSIESNHKQVESARKGQEVCIKIEPIPGESPKMFGRHFDETDMLVSKISRQSIDACKDYFRDDLTKTDWTLMVELKKLFSIL